MTSYLPDGQVICPICLARIDWGELPKWRYDADTDVYVELEVPLDASPEQRARLERGASVRCPDQGNTVGAHYLPADYGRYGQPVLLGFIGESRSGKSHLLAAMVGEIERGALNVHGISCTPVELSLHHKFIAQRVSPLLNEDKVLDQTPPGIDRFVDAYLMTSPDGSRRPVALFDVAGGELTNVNNPKPFLDIADAFIFVVDPDQLHEGGRGGHGTGDLAFKAAMDVLGNLGRLAQLSVAVVLNKADLVRFDDPITKWWLRSEDQAIDADLMLRESADVYAYLQSRGAQAWISGFEQCMKVTMHVASATGGPDDKATETYPRGVSPRRVVAPLVAVLAMTGVLQGPQAQRVGV
jgi:hypothetical protein